jgi:hypothetical protein
MSAKELSFLPINLAADSLALVMQRSPKELRPDTLSLQRFARRIGPESYLHPGQSARRLPDLCLYPQAELSVLKVEKAEMPTFRAGIPESGWWMQLLAPHRPVALMTISNDTPGGTASGCGPGDRKMKMLLFGGAEVGDGYVPMLFDERCGGGRFARRDREDPRRAAGLIAEHRKPECILGKGTTGIDPLVAAVALGQWTADGGRSGLKRACRKENENLKFFMASMFSRGDWHDDASGDERAEVNTDSCMDGLHSQTKLGGEIC